MRRTHSMAVALGAALAIGVLALSVRGGSLTPPPGPVLPTPLIVNCTSGPWQAVTIKPLVTGGQTMQVIPGSGLLHAVILSNRADGNSIEVFAGSAPLGQFFTSGAAHTTVIPLDVRYTNGVSLRTLVSVESVTLLVKPD